jgi:hypothetical protein
MSAAGGANGASRAPAGLQALLSQIVDYAGLFPPAALDMTSAVTTYARHLAGPHAWMLSRIVVPAPRLEEFVRCAAPHFGEDAWFVSALVAAAGSADLEQDLERIARFNEEQEAGGAPRAIVDTIELKGAEAGAIDAALDVIPPEIFPFFEMAVRDDPRGLIAALVGGDAGAKIRTGGAADQMPSAAEVARFVTACARAGVPFKATAGLHHPLRHDVAAGGREFGFIGVFAAGVLAFQRDLDERSVAQLLEEESIGAFVFDGDGFSWRGHRASCAEIEEARSSFASSFGSCSIDEPVADLEALRLR